MDRKFVVGDVVKCVDNQGAAWVKLRLGEHYTVVGYNEKKGTLFPTVLSKNGEKISWLLERRFELVKAAPASPTIPNHDT